MEKGELKPLTQILKTIPVKYGWQNADEQGDRNHQHPPLKKTPPLVDVSQVVVVHRVNTCETENTLAHKLKCRHGEFKSIFKHPLKHSVSSSFSLHACGFYRGHCTHCSHRVSDNDTCQSESLGASHIATKKRDKVFLTMRQGFPYNGARFSLQWGKVFLAGDARFFLQGHKVD